MRANIIFVVAACLGMTEATRRRCRLDDAKPGEGWYYTVQGDTLQKLQDDFCDREGLIRKWNNIQGHLPMATSLKVPCNARHKRDCLKNRGRSDGAYQIVSGDTLNSIGADFCTTGEDLQLANSNTVPDKDKIFPKQIIYVPCNFH
ncbi:hypothetical protein J1614_004970 [Plenodomus biglobosus]|nr:hypothetical protein J1614_004970 [Plenodomus biglobosus]